MYFSWITNAFHTEDGHLSHGPFSVAQVEEHDSGDFIHSGKDSFCEELRDELGHVFTHSGLGLVNQCPAA